MINCWKCGKPRMVTAGAMAVFCVCGTATLTQAHVVQPASPAPAQCSTPSAGGALSSAWYDAYHDEPGGREIESASDGVIQMGTRSVFVQPRWRGDYGGSVSAF
jgi:hypothetical protein